MKFLNYGTDAKTVNYILKSYDQSHLATVPVLVHPKQGSPYWSTRRKNTQLPSSVSNKNNPQRTNVQPPFSVLDANNNYMSFKTKKVYSLQEVVDAYKNLPDPHKGRLENFVKRNFFVSNGSNTTVDLYRVKRGQYTDKRFRSVHLPIIQKVLSQADKPPVGKKPVCFLYGGGSASGKSTVIDNIVKPVLKNTGLKFAELDCDAMKKQLPEFSMFSQENADTAFMRVHRESSDLTNECMEALIKAGRCFTWDGCMGDADRYRKVIANLKRANYEIHVVGVTVPTEIAIQRANLRDRKVPESVIRENHAGFAAAFPQVIQMGVDSFSLYDNSQPPGEPNQCIMNSQGIQNHELYAKFLQKAGESNG